MSTHTLLPYINDADFLKIIEEVLITGIIALEQSENKFTKNVIDPFLMLFEMGCFNLNNNDWLKNEKTRQAQKTLSNKIGWFHQKIIGSLPNWQDLGTKELVDVVCHEKQIIAEIKNKFNTVKQSDLIGLYNDLYDMVQHKTQKYHGFTAYYVEIIPKKAQIYDKCFTPSDRKTGHKARANEKIRQIDGASFYTLATGYDDALSLLFSALPKAIQIASYNLKIPINNFEYEELTEYFKAAYGAIKN